MAYPVSRIVRWNSVIVYYVVRLIDIFHLIVKVEAMLDKTICALSKVFIGASGSTFTEDILRLRKDWGSASPCDEYLCQGELPNFIAGDE